MFAFSVIVNAQVIGKIFPAMETQTIEDKTVMLPDDVKGKYTLLGLAYSKKSAFFNSVANVDLRFEI